MGWASGSAIAEAVWDIVSPFIPVKHHEKVAKELVTLFENEDCDTMYEAEELMLAAGLIDEDDLEDDFDDDEDEDDDLDEEDFDEDDEEFWDDDEDDFDDDEDDDFDDDEDDYLDDDEDDDEDEDEDLP